MGDFISGILDWLKSHWAQLLPVLSLIVATLGLILTHHSRIGQSLRRSFIRFGGKLGFTRSRYKSAFLKSHRELRNIYLNRIERLDLVATYVPLHVIDAASGRTDQPAIEVLLDPQESRILILGDPGSGKTTLLKSFGVGLVSRDSHKTPGIKVNRDLIPIYVELRDFAARLETYPTLAKYVTEYVLDRQLNNAGGEVFFKQLLARGQCVILLDALDEVGLADYDAVRVAVLTFLDDGSETLPTAEARVIMTSRTQNFLTLIDDWIPTGFQRSYVLAPFSDDDIRRFLANRASDLPPGKTPMALWEEIRSSGTLDLHRTPLVLTLSLGLYIHIPRYTIPESIARFYAEIVQELLQRHDFRTRIHLSKRNIFPAEHKLLFLREFALKMAMRPGRFDEFTHEELAGCYDTFQQKVPKLSGADRTAFLAEIIDNAGLLRRVSDDGIYVFAHRSFHEYFAAIQLSKSAEFGIKELTRRATDPLWRQVILFFAAMDHDQQDALLQGLTVANPELAGYCLAVTTGVSLDTSLSVVNRLNTVVGRSNAVSTLGALSAIARNANERVRTEALKTVERVLTEVLVPNDAAALWGLTEDDIVSLVQNLSTTGSRDVVPSGIALSRLVKDNAHFVGPLWTCLSYFVGNETAPGARQLVVRLLELAQTREGFYALQERPPLSPAFATNDLRSFVFPFRQSPGRNTNIVTLLAWADFIDAVPEKRNGFLNAFLRRRTEKQEWLNVERELAKTPIRISLYWLGVILFWGGLVACVGEVIASIVRLGWSDFASSHFLPFGSWWLKIPSVIVIGLGIAVLIGLAQLLLQDTLFRMPASDWRRRTILYRHEALDDELTIPAEEQSTSPPNISTSLFEPGDETKDSSANSLMNFLDDQFPTLWRMPEGEYYWDEDTAVALFLCAVFQIPLVLTGIWLTGTPGTYWGLVGAFLFPLVLFWLPATYPFFKSTRIDLRRRSRLASLMLDESSRVWVKDRE